MKATLLIAEGDAELCDLYRKFLMERGYEVETARDGLDCLAKLRRRLPAALVLDRSLCWGGGDGVLAWMREQRASCGVPVVLTTTAGDTEDVAEGIEPPVVLSLPKPFSLAALLESVHVALAKRENEEPLFVDHNAPRSEFFIG
jgi:two-component system OmpR family response regulator